MVLTEKRGNRKRIEEKAIKLSQNHSETIIHLIQFTSTKDELLFPVLSFPSPVTNIRTCRHG